jgi:hypothetical protein
LNQEELNIETMLEKMTNVVEMTLSSNIVAKEVREFLFTSQSLDLSDFVFIFDFLLGRGGISMSKNGNSPKIRADGYQSRLLVYIPRVSILSVREPV